MGKRRYSKDSKVELLSMEEFVEYHGYFLGVTKNNIWKSNTKPKANSNYFFFSGDRFVAIDYTYQMIGFGTDIREKLECIEVAFRDGTTEYELFDKRINQLEEEYSKHKYSKKIPDEIKRTKKAKKLIPPYEKKKEGSIKPYTEYLIDTGYTFDTNNYSERYIVFDVETNGLRTASDDLLSLTLFNPETGIAYNRFFPLDLQPVVLTTYINGIDFESIADTVHLTQDEMNWLVEYFDLYNATLLSFSGGKGLFDLSFVNHYCKRHGITGFEKLRFHNIKADIPRAPFGSEGELTKDNLCNLFDVKGVTEVHSGLNDCILEWQLFENVFEQPLFFIGNTLYKYQQDYIIPITYLNRNPVLEKYANLDLPYVLGFPELVFSYSFPPDALSQIEKFPTNISGITIEHAINSMLDVKEFNNIQFLAKNKSNLICYGSVGNKIEEIPISKDKHGMIKSLNPKFDNYVKTVNSVTTIIMENLLPLIDYLNEYVFCGEEVFSQERVISEGGKILALCDLSSLTSTLEIKTTNILKESEQYGVHIDLSTSRQLFYQSKGRNTYLLQINFERNMQFEPSLKVSIENVTVQLFSVDLKIVDKDEYNSYALMDEDIALIELVKSNCHITVAEIERIMRKSRNDLINHINLLSKEGYLIRTTHGNKNDWTITEKCDGITPVIDNSNKVFQYDTNLYDRHLQGSAMIKEYISVESAAKELGLPAGFIAVACASEKRIHSRFLFSYNDKKKRFR